MKNVIRLGMILFLLASPVLAADMSGTWTGRMCQVEGKCGPVAMYLDQDGPELSGLIEMMGGPLLGLSGRVHGHRATITVPVFTKTVCGPGLSSEIDMKMEATFGKSSAVGAYWFEISSPRIGYVKIRRQE